MSDKTSQNTISVVSISLFGKLTALLSRTMYMAIFGASNPYLNAYVYALDMPNVIFNCLGTALNTVVIPIYSSLLAGKADREAKKFLDNIISISVTLITALVVLGIMAAPFISAFYGENTEPEYASFLVFALRLLLPVMIFYGFNYIFQGILQSHGKFKLPVLVSLPSGVIIIIYLLLFSEKWGVTGLIIATAIGLFAQPAIMVPAIRKLGYKYKFSFDLKNTHVRSAGALTIPVLASVSSYQINFLFNNTMALGFGTVSLMSYAQTLVQAFMLTIVYAISGVYFPKLSSLWALNDKDGYSKSLKELIEHMLFLVLPAACGLIVLRGGIMDFLLNWKGQADSDIVMAARLLGLYSAGIIAISLKEVLDKAFYSVKDTKTPAVFGFVIMAVNVIVTLALLSFLGPYSMPVAYVVSAFTGTFGLLIKVNGISKLAERAFIVSIIKTLLAVALMVAAAAFALRLSEGIYVSGVTVTKIIRLVIPASAGAVVYILASYVLKIPAFAALLGRRRRV